MERPPRGASLKPPERRAGFRRHGNTIQSGSGAAKRIFLLSPANCSGERAQLALSDQARFEVALQLRSAQGAPLGEVFSFLSGLYFRGKLAYARMFARAPQTVRGIWVITPGRGLQPEDQPITVADLRDFARIKVDTRNEVYRRPLMSDTQALAQQLDKRCEVVLLGSIATGKYLDILRETLGDRVRVPAEFIGRGDMSRGALMLRCVAQAQELEYIAIPGSIRTER